MKQKYSEKKSNNQNLKPKSETIQFILNFSKSFKVLKTKIADIIAEVSLN